MTRLMFAAVLAAIASGVLVWSAPSPERPVMIVMPYDPYNP